MKKKSSKKSAPARHEKNAPNRYPKGWNRQRVQAVIDHYENQTEDQAIAEDEAAYNDATATMMAVPIELVPKAQKLIAKRAG
jgi:nanoRNase/pAp phosphatase (c-di-AMP/oligoRNAs hydrolase)